MTVKRITDDVLRRHPAATLAPGPPTDVELQALIGLLRARGAKRIAVGHGRYPHSVATAVALIDGWTASDGVVCDVVDWPARAASWLRPARRLAAAHPDQWVLVDTPAGCAQLVTRLAEQPDWTAGRTVLTSSAYAPDLAVLIYGQPELGGVTADGNIWRVGRGVLIVAAHAPAG